MPPPGGAFGADAGGGDAMPQYTDWLMPEPMSRHVVGYAPKLVAHDASEYTDSDGEEPVEVIVHDPA